MNPPEDGTPVSQIHLDALFGQFEEKDPVTEFPKFQNVVVASKGSGILSNVRQERIMARRARIEKQLMRANRGGDGGKDSDTTEKKLTDRGMPSFSPVLETAKNLRRTAHRNEQVLQGYLRGACRRRVYRDQAVKDHLLTLDKRLSEHKKVSELNLRKKLHKYDNLANQTLGLDELVMLLDKYKRYGKEFIDAKQIFVDEIEDELKSLDDNFSRMLRSFQKDMDLIRKKATDMTLKLTNIYRKEVQDLDKTFAGLESEYIQKLAKLREKSQSEVRMRDDAIMVEMEEFMEEMLSNMKVLRTIKLDSFLEVKLTLDSDVLLMTEQLQNMRASFLVNAEKLDYNLEVIQLREEESIKTKNKQKRIITKIQDEVARATNELRSDERKTENKLFKHKNEYIEMTSELVQLHHTFDEAAGKEWSTFRDSWISNELALRDGLRTILLLDRFITEEICNHEWGCPNLWMLGHIGPIHAPKWRAQVERHREAMLVEETAQSQEATQKIKEEHEVFWSILNIRTKRLSVFRRMSLVRRVSSPGFNKTSSRGEGSEDNKEYSNDPADSPPFLLGPVLRWILNHFDFLNEDYLVDVVNQLTWQDAFFFQIQAFLNHFKQFNYDDLCKLALFFVRFSIRTNDAVGNGETFTEEDIATWLNKLTPQEFLHRRITFNDVLQALQAFLEHKQDPGYQQNFAGDRKVYGRMRDASADLDYLKQYTEMFDLGTKSSYWQQLLYGLRNEAKTSETKISLVARTKMLQEKNTQLKQMLKKHLTCEDDDLFIFPPLWNKMDVVAHELCNSIRKPVQLRGRTFPLGRAKSSHQVQTVGLSKSGTLMTKLEPSNPFKVDGVALT